MEPLSSPMPRRNSHFTEQELKDRFKRIRYLFKGRVFSGCCVDRIFIEQLKEFRSAILLHSTELSLDADLKELSDILERFGVYRKCSIWVGFKHYPALNSSNGLRTCIWAKMNNIRCGEYWFTISSLSYKPREITFSLTALMPISKIPRMIANRSAVFRRPSSGNNRRNLRNTEKSLPGKIKSVASYLVNQGRFYSVIVLGSLAVAYYWKNVCEYFYVDEPGSKALASFM